MSNVYAMMEREALKVSKRAKGLTLIASGSLALSPGSESTPLGFYWSEFKKEFVANTDEGWRFLNSDDTLSQLPAIYGEVMGPFDITASAKATAAFYARLEKLPTWKAKTAGFYFCPSNTRPHERVGYFDGTSWLFVGDHGKFKFSPKTFTEFVFGVIPSNPDTALI